MKKDLTTRIYKEVFGIDEGHANVNEFMKAIIINFGDERGDIIVENDNFGTNEKYADFTEGKKKAGLHPMQIVFSGVDMAQICHEKYIDVDGNIRTFGEKGDSVEAIKKVYAYIGHDLASVRNDMEHDYLTENEGRDGHTYLWYMDESTCVAVDKDTLEIHEDEDFFEDQFC